LPRAVAGNKRANPKRFRDSRFNQLSCAVIENKEIQRFGSDAFKEDAMSYRRFSAFLILDHYHR
jgi:hypothetical protein